jgi:hypothetical protein
LNLLGVSDFVIAASQVAKQHKRSRKSYFSG